MKNLFLSFIMMSMLVSVANANLVFSKVESVGLLKHKVIYTSPKYKLKKTNQGIKAYVKMIAMWGTHRYEVGVSEYNCSSAGRCEFNQWISLSMYDSCQVKSKKAKCYGKISGSSVANSSQYSYSTKGFLETFEKDFESENTRTNSMNEVEFPERGSEYWEYPSNLF